MWTHWSITRLVRWRVRDWASCFTACRFPLDEDKDSFPSSPPQLPIRNMVKGKRTRRRKECNKDRYGSIDSQSQQNIADDEDYIVFCFSEDGAFDVVKDGKSEPSSNHIDCTRRSSWPVNRKINFGESEKIVNATNEEEIIPVKEYEEEDAVYLDIESAASRYQSDQGMVSVESSDSNRSDNSTASFAFPVLGWEWMDSPAQMPKSEVLHLRKHKPRSLTFHCCRF
ncbi:hypothetical protein QYF36_016139 [Acer negundo]|nr:hypothetical protein QYF36_016139 [Acer negundo]